MEVIIVENEKAGSLMAAKRVASLIKTKKQTVLGLATGNTPLSTYKELVSLKNSKEINFDHVTCFNLDEYVGLDKQDPNSYYYYMNKNFYEPLGLNPSHCFIPDGQSDDIASECNNYESLIKEKGPIDLQILGIGRDAHIGFNEPGSSIGSRTRLKTLTETTRKDNASLFGDLDKVPMHCITMGIQSILEAKEIILLAFGEAKAKAVAKAVEGPLSANTPASALQLHPKVKVIIDEAAASELKNTKYYKEVFSKKPNWQTREFAV